MSWVTDEAKNTDPRKERVILENPVVVRELDEILTNQYYSQINPILEATGYPFKSIDDDGFLIESRWSGPDLGRCLTFMIFDDFSLPILRGSFTRSRYGFMFEREFSLGLPRATDPLFLFRVLSDDDFAGNSPTLTIEPSLVHPESEVYYWITLRNGTGIESGQWTLDQAAIGSIEETITTSIEMYESTVDGFQTMAQVEEFIALARRSFEAS